MSKIQEERPGGLGWGWRITSWVVMALVVAHGFLVFEVVSVNGEILRLKAEQLSERTLLGVHIAKLWERLNELSLRMLEEKLVEKDVIAESEMTKGK